MSQQEFDQADQQVIGMVEKHAHPEAKKAAQFIVGSMNAKNGAAEQRRQMLWTVIQVLCCILVAVLFVAALMDPSFVTFLVNMGVLVCGMAAAVLIDRSSKIWRKR